MAKVEIVELVEEWEAHFASLNYEWIEQYFTVETHDKEILDDPRTFVIEPGGQIFFAIVSGLAAGTVALIPDGRGSLELTKMAVSPEFQGMGIGDRLMEKCVEYAVDQKINIMWLESHTKLAAALSLYTKHGFVEVPVNLNSLYARADIRMELAISRPNM